MALERAKLDAELSVLARKKEAAAASAEADVLEAAAVLGIPPSIPLSQRDIAERTQEYVDKQMPVLHPETDTQAQPAPTPHADTPVHNPVLSVPLPPQHVQHESTENIETHLTSNPAPNQGSPSSSSPLFRDEIVEHSSTHQGSPQNFSAMNDIAKFLAKRELITTGLTQFDDRPENFRAWQSSFHNATRDIGLSAKEELDLLLKWLGKESSDHVRRLRAVHVHDPDTALKKSWERLKEQYAAPEVIESILFRKLDAFPRIPTKDPLKLRELGDLLNEVRSAKEDGYLPGLSYLDTARGINPTVEKLPHSLQEKWITKAAKYKAENSAHFPPFSFFADFIYMEAKTRNDPSFAFSRYE